MQPIINTFCELVFYLTVAAGIAWVFGFGGAGSRGPWEDSLIRPSYWVFSSAAVAQTLQRSGRRLAGLTHVCATMFVASTELCYQTAWEACERNGMFWNEEACSCANFLGYKRTDYPRLLAARESSAFLRAYVPVFLLLDRLVDIWGRWWTSRRRRPKWSRAERSLGYTTGSLVPLSVVLSWAFWSGFFSAVASRARAWALRGRRKRPHRRDPDSSSTSNRSRTASAPPRTERHR